MPISWGPSEPYDTGDSNAVALDDQGHAVEVHVGSGRLFSRVGTADFISDLGSITWGPSVEYDTGDSNAVARDNQGHVVEVHVGSGRLFYRVGHFTSQCSGAAFS
jgi:hypothetical protein